MQRFEIRADGMPMVLAAGTWRERYRNRYPHQGEREKARRRRQMGVQIAHTMSKVATAMEHETERRLLDAYNGARSA